MYGQHKHRIAAAINRLGSEVKVLDRESGTSDGFGNPTSDFADNGKTALCFRTYPNRNTEVQNSSGDRHRDRALFVFPIDEAPDSDTRIVYTESDSTTTKYELQSPTKYDTHVEIFGERVVNE